MKTVTTRLDSRLAAYAAVATAALAAPALPNAEAAIVYSGPVNIVVPATTAGIYINLVTGAFTTTPAGTPGWDLNPWGSTALNTWANNAASLSDGVINNFAGGTSATLVDNLPVGTLINGTFTFGRTSGPETTGPTIFNLNSSNNYIGMRFLNEATGALNFGWVQFSLGATAATRSIVGYGFENTGATIAVGQVPEPTTTALLGVMAAGALGLRAWRKRKAA